MKIYNEVVSKFNELTQQWETISEDSFNYSGPMALAQGPPNSSPISTSDTIADTIKTTTGYFSNGDGTLEGSSVYTGSTSATNEKYYFNVNNKVETDANSEVQFSVTFGHIVGSGSDTYGDSSLNPRTLRGETEAIYKQFSETLQLDTEVTGGFKMSQQGSAGAISSGNSDEYFYALVGKRSRFKDRLNKKAWTLTLSGSTSDLSGSELKLTDDSKLVAAVATPGGPRHNIVSGALGVPSGSGYTYKTYGWFYPEMGIMLFSGAELSASIPGGPTFGREISSAATGLENGVTASHGSTLFSSSNATVQTAFATMNVGDMFKFVSSSTEGTTTFISKIVGEPPAAGGFTSSREFTAVGSTAAGYIHTGSLQIGIPTTQLTASWGTDNFRASASGFAPNLHNKGNPKNALRLVNCMNNFNGTTLRLRSEEDKTEENYFCRIGAKEYNFSSNHTFVSGSKNKLRAKDMHGNPQTFITGIGLYNSSGQLLAIAKLSKPLIKNFATEATIKVKLTY